MLGKRVGLTAHAQTMGLKTFCEDCPNGIESWALETQMKVGSSLLLESEELQERRQQKLQMLAKGMPSVKPLYGQNVS